MLILFVSNNSSASTTSNATSNTTGNSNAYCVWAIIIGQYKQTLSGF